MSFSDLPHIIIAQNENYASAYFGKCKKIYFIDRKLRLSRKMAGMIQAVTK